MTVTVYQASFADSTGKKFHGSISSDKYTPKRLDAAIAQHISAHETDYPVWTDHAASGREGMRLLIRKITRKAQAMKLTLIEEAETKYAPKEELPDLTGKSVLITAGEHAGEEAVCLGSADDPGLFAVSPHSSNQILRLRFDEDFGILLNPGQRAGRN